MSEVQGRGGGATVRCEQARVLLMGYIDGELEAEQRARLEDHLAVCVDCRSEERAYRRLGQLTETIRRHGGSAADADAAWAGIYSRLERRLGWILMSAGLSVLILFGLWQMAREFLLDASVPLALRVGLGTFVAGCVVLLVSFARERWARDRQERYREIER